MNYIKYRPLRAWYNGSTSASQAEDEGSIPFARTKNLTGPCAGLIIGLWRRKRTRQKGSSQRRKGPME